MMHKSGAFKGRERWVVGNRERENIAGVLILVLFQTQCAYLIPSQVCNGGAASHIQGGDYCIVMKSLC